MSKSDITSGMQDSAEASQTRCASCKHVFAPSVEVTFSVGREQKEDRKERVHFFDKVRLEAVAKERYKQGGRKSFTITLLAEERCALRSVSRARPLCVCRVHVVNVSAAHETESSMWTGRTCFGTWSTTSAASRTLSAPSSPPSTGTLSFVQVPRRHRSEAFFPPPARNNILQLFLGW